MWRALASNMILILIVALGAVAVGVTMAQRQWTAEGPLAQATCLTVDRGSNFGIVARDLEAQGAVGSATFFRTGVDYARLPGLKAGAFRLPEGASMAEIADIVTRGGASTCGTEVNYRIGVNSADVRVRELDPSTERFEEVAAFDVGEAPPERYEAVRASADTRYRITVAEGTTSWQVWDALQKLDLLEGEAGERPPEGSLAPDSYEVEVGTQRAELLATMAERQSERLAVAWATREDGLPYETPEEALVMASIVEKETGQAEERPQVASVFVNRLREGMRLQTDPTVIYGITNGQGVLGRGLRRSELDRTTPYNTYRIDGLPPTPIANPGEAAIQAALNPDETEYLFFVADGTGGHAFATNLADHNRNVAAWREIEAQRASD